MFLCLTESHEKGFITFIISATVYMITTIILCQWRRSIHNNNNSTDIVSTTLSLLIAQFINYCCVHCSHCKSPDSQRLCSFSNLDQSRFVRRDRSTPVKKNAQIFLVVVGVVVLFSSAQSAADHALFQK